jgi:adenylosuccinate synthase
MSISRVDIVCGLAWGDEAKGKIVSYLLENSSYDWVCRWSGGSNAGHTIYIKGKKYVTHIVPAGILHGILSYIGPDCYIHIESFIKELDYLKENGFDTSKIYVSPKTHVITDDHIEQDTYYKKTQGSTGSGIAPCAKDKYGRKGVLFESIDKALFKNHTEHICLNTTELYGTLLCEGAQGTWLDINYGNYPFVTSSTTLPYSACSLGFSHQKIRHIYGASKIYDTRVGKDPLFPDCLDTNKELVTIGNIGQELGSTTGRKRRVNWLNLDLLIQSVNLTGCTVLIVSKVDILNTVNMFKLFYKSNLKTFNTIEHMIEFIKTILFKQCEYVDTILFSDNPYNIKDSIKYERETN